MPTNDLLRIKRDLEKERAKIKEDIKRLNDPKGHRTRRIEEINEDLDKIDTELTQVRYN